MTRQQYQFLIDIATYESQINQLSSYSQENCDCFALLQDTLDRLCFWILDEANQVRCDSFGILNAELDRRLKYLRESAIKALCALERHQAECAAKHTLDISTYLKQLSASAASELKTAGINDQSKVLFIGSGSYPLSAFTISEFTGATVRGVDIDEQAVSLANQLTDVPSITFSHDDLMTEFNRFQPTHIIVASLVEHKWELLASLRPYLQHSQKILVRFGNGLKSAFNYPFNPQLSLGWNNTPVNDMTGIYDAVIMEKQS